MGQETERKPATDWHTADIKAAIEKTGWSLRQLSLKHGLAPNTMKAALERPYPKAERIIAEVLGLKPEDIWPERYAKRALKASHRVTPDRRTLPKQNTKRANARNDEVHEGI